MVISIVLDLIVLAIIAVFALISAKRGFVRTLIEIVGFVLVLLLANSVSTPLADFTYDKAVEPSIIKSVENFEIQNSAGALDEMVLPEFITTVIGQETITDFQTKINENINNGIDTAVTTASQNVIKPLVTSFLSMFFVVVITIVLLFIVNLLAKLINKLFSFSVVGKLNRSLGAVLGGIKGIIISIVFCTLVALIVSLTENGFLIFTKDAIENTFLFKLFCLKF